MHYYSPGGERLPAPNEQVSNYTVLKEDQIFITTNAMGDMPIGASLGLYYKDTRYLSLYTLTLEGKEPVLLSASSEHNFMANLQLANPALGLGDGSMVLPNTISLRRNRLVQGGVRERIGLFNYNPFPVRLHLTLELGADFRDMFDVRGFRRDSRGTIHPPRWENGVLTLAYEGLDRRSRHTSVSFDPLPTTVDILPAPADMVVEHRLDAIYPGNTPTVKDVIMPPTTRATWEIDLEPHTPWFVNVSIVPEGREGWQPAFLFDNDARELRVDYDRWYTASTRLRTDNEVFDSLLDRALADLRVLTDRVPGGLFPAAGIPWYSVPFGRDSLITGLQTVMFKPDIATGTLLFLAEHQGKDVNDWRDEEPGKILHEMRTGEMATLNEIPHTPYYGTIDATLLFIMLFVEAMRWTADDAFYDAMIPHVKLALDWIDKYGDVDGDGYVEYQTKSRWGLRNQGWKDSYDSLKFPDNRLPEPPIALVEVQAYVYAAKMGMSELFLARGERKEGIRLGQEAHILKERFNHDFWMPGREFYAQALDGSKRQVPSISSNAGHALYTGIADERKAAKVVSRLMASDMLSGWGIRTLSSEEPHFNPMSYHNGSVWPHDNGMIAAGMRRYGFNREAIEVIEQVIQAGIRFKLFRMPELYCGFARDLRYYSVPAEYPVSCSPQAWAAGSILHFCQILLGAQPTINASSLALNPCLLPSLTQMRVENLSVGSRAIDFVVDQASFDTVPSLTIENNPGDLKVVTS